MTNISDIKYVQAPEKRPGKRTLIAGITLVAVNIVMAILLSVASGFFNDPRFSMVTRFFNIYLYFIIGAIAIAVGIYRMVNEKGTSRTYHAEIKSNNGEYNLRHSLRASGKMDNKLTCFHSCNLHFRHIIRDFN